MRECLQMHPEELAAWVDGAAEPRAAAAVAAHVAACPRCAASADRLRAQKTRLARYRAATTPAGLPEGLWERARAGLDAADAIGRCPSTNDQRGDRTVGRWSFVVGR